MTESFRIVTDGPGWVLLAVWFGKERVIHRGSVIGCIAKRQEIISATE